MEIDREIEIERYCQSWFWHENKKSDLLVKLLNKIYNLEDEVLKLKKLNKKNENN